MYDVGDSVPLSVSPLDADGNPVDVTGLQLTVVRPDSSDTGALTPAHPAEGSYSYLFATTQAGRHLAKWAGSGFAETSVFNVWPADPRMLLSLADAKRALQLLPTSTSRDEDLRLYITAVTPVIEDIVGPLLGSGSVSADGGSRAVLIPPGATVTSVIENGVTLDPGVYTVNTAAGIITAGPSHAPRRFMWGTQSVLVNYQLTAPVPPNVLLAARKELRWLWDMDHRSAHPDLGDNDTDTDYTPSGFAVPREVIQLCAGSRRGPVVG
jgi:hypothetical protein